MTLSKIPVREIFESIGGWIREMGHKSILKHKNENQTNREESSREK